jgi:hypothetical protein
MPAFPSSESSHVLEGKLLRIFVQRNPFSMLEGITTIVLFLMTEIYDSR